MRRLHLSVSGISILLALSLAAWEYYFFWYGGTHALGSLDGRLGWFTPNRLGFNLTWLAAIYLTYQLISIRFALPGPQNRFIGVVDGLTSLVPQPLVTVVMIGRPQVPQSPEHWD